MKKYKIKDIMDIFIIISIICFILYMILLFQKNSIQMNLFFRNFEDLFADFFNVVIYSSDRDPYNNVLNGLGEKAYLPISYLLLYPFSKICDFGYISNLKECFTISGIICVSIFSYISLCLFIVSLNKLCKKMKINRKILIPIYLSGILLHTIERGNLIIISVSLVLFFLTYYDSKKKQERLLAAFCLAFSSCLKFYPFIFGILYLKDKKYKDATICALMAILLAFLPFLFIKGGFSNIPLLIRNVGYNSETYSSVAMYSGLSLKNFSNYLFHGLLHKSPEVVKTVGNINFYAFLVLNIMSVILAFLSKNKKKLIIALCFATIFIQSNSRFYCILYLIPAYLIIFENINKNNYKKYLPLIICIGFILTPLRIKSNYFAFGQSINEYLIVLLIIILSIIQYFSLQINLIKSFKKRSSKI